MAIEEDAEGTDGADTDDAGNASRDQERRATLRVLVVDDMSEVRFLMEISLSREPGIRLIGQAENGLEALEKVELLRPDVIVMDRQMPIMDGATATREIKARWPHVEVVGFTSSGTTEAHDEMCEAGASESFEKADTKGLLDFIRGRAAVRFSAASTQDPLLLIPGRGGRG